ncbi:hypothetical protein Pyrde_0861 [Pyrodictium delaneyi]|uniref:Uncharacterized protein n=1 Tax=Pyrodictium delaneyi TaxID=1273541 RepID=A0A0P0N203_9CREN|nr:hypothetical protein [Pyrodictium delaneyi]ALL00911.1 hypothetical protein Pyrde_0861 [Pyrodictium delaneyi]OWJ55471.1 hypothetical protein Pdsh_01345 [Pyrodictium delaneyi]
MLAGIRLLCKRCHLAKHQGYALVIHRRMEAIEQLAAVNGLDIEAVKTLVEKAFKVWRELSSIDDWRIVLEELPGLDVETRRTIESILSTMASEGYSLDNKWLHYLSPTNTRRLEEEALRESVEFLRRALGADRDEPLEMLLAELLIADNQQRVLQALKHKLGKAGIEVLSKEASHALTWLRPDRLEVGPNGKQLLDITSTSGKWMVFVKRRLRGRFLAEVIRRLREKKLDYAAKTVGIVENSEEQPVIVYVPSFLAVSLVVEVAKTIAEVAREFRVRKPIMFKPDTFTRRGIYSHAGHSTGPSIKPYIYVVKGY